MAKTGGLSGNGVTRLGNPLGISAILAILSLVARVLKSLGVLDELEARAEKTDTPVDNIAIRLAKSVLEELAK